MALILVVDDDPQMLRLISSVVQLDSHDVLLAQDGEIALTYFDDCTPDLMITDLLMPNKEGLELISEVRGRQIDIKIIAYSGGGAIDSESCLAFASGMGADKALSKPMSMQVLREQIQQLLVEP